MRMVTRYKMTLQLSELFPQKLMRRRSCCLQARNLELGHLQGGREELIVVASLIDRIPNLAGLAHTCEVFKTASLLVADATIVEDRQFELIRFLRPGCLIFWSTRKRVGSFSLGWSKLQTSLLMSSHFPTKWSWFWDGRKKAFQSTLSRCLMPVWRSHS